MIITILGTCPYDDCDESLFGDSPDGPFPIFFLHDCDGCGRGIVTEVNYVSACSYTKKDFFDIYTINHETRTISKRNEYDE